MPSTARFSCCWKARTAASVFGPKMPSTVTLCPRVRSRYCKLGTGCFWSPFFVSGQGLIVPETMSAPFTEVRPESESVIAPVDTSDSRWASATARSRLTDTDQNGGSPLQASVFGGSGAFATGDLRIRDVRIRDVGLRDLRDIRHQVPDRLPVPAHPVRVDPLDRPVVPPSPRPGSEGLEPVVPPAEQPAVGRVGAATGVIGPVVVGAAVWFCDADHNRPYDSGGCTDADNCGLLCRRHHRLKTFTTWSWRRGDDGGIEWIDPNGVRWDREPIRYLMPDVSESEVSESDVSDSDVPDSDVPDSDVPDSDVSVAKAPEPPAAQPEACSGDPPF